METTARGPFPCYYYGSLPMELRGKVALITGASEGIGAACAKLLGHRGALLVLTARSETKLRQTGGGDALVVPGDITQPGVPERVVEAALDRHGRIDLLINNAGVGLYSPSWKAPIPETRAMFELNFFSALRMIQAVAPHMCRLGGGSIVNVSSIAGKVTLPWLTLYSASKSAVASLGDGLRMELEPAGVHVMTVCPGYVDTGFQSHILGGQVPAAIWRSRDFTITAGKCAEAIVRGIEKRKRTVVTPRLGWALISLAALFPGVIDSQLMKVNARGDEPAGGGPF